MTNLLKIGLIIVPFYELVIKCFPSAVIVYPDTRGPKLTLSLMIALAVGLWCLFEGKLKSFQNKGILAFVAYAFMCMQFAPNIPLSINGNNSSMFWMWKPVLIIFIYSFLIISVASLDFTKKEVKQVVNIMSGCGVAMSLYVFIQWLRLDQFFGLNPVSTGIIGGDASIAGTLGNPTLAASFLAIILPVAVSMKNKIPALIVAGALILINSKIAFVAAVIGMIAYALFTKAKKFLYCILAVAVLVSALYLVKLGPSDWTDCGRFNNWKQVMTYWKTPLDVKGVKQRHTMTGFGPSSYEYMFPVANKSAFLHPHNEYIYILFNFGILGLGIFLYSIFLMFKNLFTEAQAFDYFHYGLISSFITAMACAGGTFILGLGAHSFYLAIIVGLLHNKQFLQGRRCDA